MSKNRLVYSTESGRICPQCSNPVFSCTCKKKKELKNNSSEKFPDKGIVRISRQVKGRKGKTVTVISNTPLENSSLKILAKKLKTLCGSGGSVKEGIIVIQGDHRQVVLDEIKKLGYSAKLAGG
ncbi:stress response translation initiation inhibitor YciH [Thermodesulfobacteriota bacterium]